MFLAVSRQFLTLQICLHTFWLSSPLSSQDMSNLFFPFGLRSRTTFKDHFESLRLGPYGENSWKIKNITFMGAHAPNELWKKSRRSFLHPKMCEEDENENHPQSRFFRRLVTPSVQDARITNIPEPILPIEVIRSSGCAVILSLQVFVVGGFDSRIFWVEFCNGWCGGLDFLVGWLDFFLSNEGFDKDLRLFENQTSWGLLATNLAETKRSCKYSANYNCNS